jgi:hypothetical protein
MSNVLGTRLVEDGEGNGATIAAAKATAAYMGRKG